MPAQANRDVPWRSTMVSGSSVSAISITRQDLCSDQTIFRSIAEIVSKFFRFLFSEAFTAIRYSQVENEDSFLKRFID
jgi:hypothetical protein